jgi:hypothetical protein
MTDREPKKIDPENDMPDNIKRDPKRDLGSVPSSFNPGNQAGKGRDAPNPGQTGTPGGKGKQDGPQNQKR